MRYNWKGKEKSETNETFLHLRPPWYHIQLAVTPRKCDRIYNSLRIYGPLNEYRSIGMGTLGFHFWSEVMKIIPGPVLEVCCLCLKLLRGRKAGSSAFPFCLPAFVFEGPGPLNDNNSKVLLWCCMSESSALLWTPWVGAIFSTLRPCCFDRGSLQWPKPLPRPMCLLWSNMGALDLL